MWLDLALSHRMHSSLLSYANMYCSSKDAGKVELTFYVKWTTTTTRMRG
jgi:hypothetical protein